MLNSISENNRATLLDSVRAQARLRVRLGIPVCLLMLLCIWQWGPSAPGIGPWHVVPAFTLHTFYNFAVLLIARKAIHIHPRHLANFTAVMDPLLLSLGLALMSQFGQLFTCFYLFTILGFGFRIGSTAMAVCQVASIIGFTCVALVSPPWRGHPVPAMSVLMFLAVVPLYARALITRLQLACEHAESESRAKTQLLANVSHELRTPLTGIVSSAQLMREENDDAQVRKRSDTILTLSRELMVQINDLLDSAKYGADALRLEKSPFRMADIAEQLRRTLGATALSKGLMLQVCTDHRMPALLLGDVYHIARVMLNLGGNAIKFTDHGEVIMGMSVLDENARSCHVRFSCRDTGIGIAPALHQKIFEPFFQASAGTARRYGGTGLGMSIAHGILERMGSVIRVQSAPGQGSLFEFDLWLDKAEPLPREDMQNPEIVRNKRILLADDNATNLMLTRELLERDGHQVLSAASGREAIRLLDTPAIDLAILDFNMGDIDGASVLQIYRFGKLAPAPVYILTADNAPATARRLMDGGAAGVLHKPVDLMILRQAISDLFSAGPPLPRKDCAAICIDASTIGELRALGNDHRFFEQVLNTAAADIDLLCTILCTTIGNQDLIATRDRAHALKGISLSVGAVQLCAIAARLTHIVQADLQHEGAALAAQVAAASAQTVSELRSIVYCSQPG